MKIFNCSPKLDKKVYIPSRKELIPALESISSNVVDVVLPAGELITTVATHIGQHLNVDVLHAENSRTELGSIEVNATYYSERDQENTPSIELVLIGNPMDHYYHWNRETFERISYQIIDCLIHEIVHMHQARARSFMNIIPPLHEKVAEYFGNADEIHAFSFNIADELSNCGPVDIKQWLEQPSRISLEVSPSLWTYINVFEKNVQHPKVKRLLKKVYKHYKKLN